MILPAYKLTLGSTVIDTINAPKQSTVTNIFITLGLDIPADSFTLSLGQVGGIQPAPGVATTIELGYASDGKLTQVMSGAIAAVEPGLTTRRIVGYSKASALQKTCINQTYESKTAGQIVRDLANRAGVEVGNVEEGIQFPAYVIDDRRSAYHHLHDLAALCGFDLYVNAEGKLMFHKFVGGKTVHMFEYAKHIIELDINQTSPRAGQVEVFGESPAGQQGTESWAWLTKDFSGSKGKAGSGGSMLMVENAVLRTRDAANSAAQSAMEAIQRRVLCGRLLSLGRPEVKLGDAIRLSGMPEKSMNASYQVCSVRHHINKKAGFTTTVGFMAIPTGTNS